MDPVIPNKTGKEINVFKGRKQRIKTSEQNKLSHGVTSQIDDEQEQYPPNGSNQPAVLDVDVTINIIAKLNEEVKFLSRLLSKAKAERVEFLARVDKAEHEVQVNAQILSKSFESVFTKERALHDKKYSQQQQDNAEKEKLLMDWMDCGGLVQATLNSIANGSDCDNYTRNEIFQLQTALEFLLNRSLKACKSRNTSPMKWSSIKASYSPNKHPPRKSFDQDMNTDQDESSSFSASNGFKESSHSRRQCDPNRQSIIVPKDNKNMTRNMYYDDALFDIDTDIESIYQDPCNDNQSNDFPRDSWQDPSSGDLLISNDSNMSISFYQSAMQSFISKLSPIKESPDSRQRASDSMQGNRSSHRTLSPEKASTRTPSSVSYSRSKLKSSSVMNKKLTNDKKVHRIIAPSSMTYRSKQINESSVSFTDFIQQDKKNPKNLAKNQAKSPKIIDNLPRSAHCEGIPSPDESLDGQLKEEDNQQHGIQGQQTVIDEINVSGISPSPFLGNALTDQHDSMGLDSEMEYDLFDPFTILYSRVHSIVDSDIYPMNESDVYSMNRYRSPSLQSSRNSASSTPHRSQDMDPPQDEPLTMLSANNDSYSSDNLREKDHEMLEAVDKDPRDRVDGDDSECPSQLPSNESVAIERQSIDRQQPENQSKIPHPAASSSAWHQLTPMHKNLVDPRTKEAYHIDVERYKAIARPDKPSEPSKDDDKESEDAKESKDSHIDRRNQVDGGNECSKDDLCDDYAERKALNEIEANEVDRKDVSNAFSIANRPSNLLRNDSIVKSSSSKAIDLLDGMISSLSKKLFPHNEDEAMTRMLPSQSASKISNRSPQSHGNIDPNDPLSIKNEMTKQISREDDLNLQEASHGDDLRRTLDDPYSDEEEYYLSEEFERESSRTASRNRSRGPSRDANRRIDRLVSNQMPLPSSLAMNKDEDIVKRGKGPDSIPLNHFETSNQREVERNDSQDDSYEDDFD